MDFQLDMELILEVKKFDISYVSQSSYFTNKLYSKGLTTPYTQQIKL